MIRDYKNTDLDRVMELWLNTNILAHSFIDREYWVNNYDVVKDMIATATVYVYEENGIIQGFVGLMDNYIAGIFVSQQFQSKGIGKSLLNYVKMKRELLSLCVYQKNDRAVNFYLREGFVVSNKKIYEDTGETEFSMLWDKLNK